MIFPVQGTTLMQVSTVSRRVYASTVKGLENKRNPVDKITKKAVWSFC